MDLEKFTVQFQIDNHYGVEPTNLTLLKMIDVELGPWLLNSSNYNIY